MMFVPLPLRVPAVQERELLKLMSADPASVPPERIPLLAVAGPLNEAVPPEMLRVVTFTVPASLKAPVPTKLSVPAPLISEPALRLWAPLKERVAPPAIEKSFV